MTELGPRGVEAEKVYTEAEDIKSFADFFGLEPESDQILRLTGLDALVINGIMNGTVIESERRDHSAILGRFARITEQALTDLTVGPLNREKLNAWLEEGEVETSQGLARPIEILADSALAQEAIEQVQQAMWS